MTLLKLFFILALILNFVASQKCTDPTQYDAAIWLLNGECLDCPDYYSCSDITMEICPAGKTSSAGSSECSGCLAGYYCIGGKQVACEANHYSTQGMSYCPMIPLGQEVESNIIQSCGAKEYTSTPGGPCTLINTNQYISALKVRTRPAGAYIHDDGLGISICPSGSACP